MKVRYRVAAGFALLLVLFLALVFVQLVVGDRLRSEHAQQADRIARTRDTNRAVLQFMTDAETAVRGFQLTGETAFLGPYDSGRTGALTAFDELETAISEPELRRLLTAERGAAVDWLYAYAIPIVDAGVADADDARAAHGKVMFDRVRAAHVALDAAIAEQERATAAAHRHDARRSELLFAGLAGLVLLTALVLAALHHRQLLAPLEHIRLTLRRLAAGDLSARAVPSGPGELRAVIGTLNDLAAQTQQLLAAEQARAARGELRQAVTAELRSGAEPMEIADRLARMIGSALSADAVHGQAVVERGERVAVTWPSGATSLPEETARAILDTSAGTVVNPRDEPGVLGVPLDGHDDGPGGLICVIRSGGSGWTADERRLLATVAQEVDHAVRQQRLNQSQKRLISELRTLDEQKDVFVSTVTHELRTPLTSILGYTEMLADEEDEGLSPMQRRGVSAILRNAHRLHDTVADLLLLGRANDGVGAQTVPVDLAAVAAAVHDELGPAANGKGLRATLETAPAWVRGDRDQLERALRNLIGNAIKFTHPGGELACRVSAGEHEVVVTVTDTGIGIPPDDLPGLFTPFHRAANAMHEAVQGSGLGLAIVRNIVTEHSGTIAARSEPGHGSTFTLTLPAAAAAVA